MSKQVQPGRVSLQENTKERDASSYGSSFLAYLRPVGPLLVLLGFVATLHIYTVFESYQEDFRAFYVAARSSHAHLDPYQNNGNLGTEFVDPANKFDKSRFIYPPSSLPLFTFGAYLPYNPARFLFSAVSILVIAVVLLYFAYRYRVDDIWIILAFLSLPVVASMERGQIDILLLALVLLAFLLKKIPILAGFFLAVAISIKVFPAVLLLWFAATKRYATAASAIVCSTLIGAVTIAIWHVNSYTHFWHNLITNTDSFGLDKPLDQTSFGMLSHGKFYRYTHTYVGGFNNPLEMFGTKAIFLSAVIMCVLFFLIWKRSLRQDTSFYCFLLTSQIVNTSLWIMGMVVYLPFYLMSIGKLKSKWSNVVLTLPLFLPAQVRFHGISPRYILALALMFYFLPQIGVVDCPEQRLSI